MKDKVHFFAAYEGNAQDRENEVRPDTWGAWSPAFRQGFTQYQGLYPSEFRSTLLFGKLSATLNDSSNVDVSGDYRHETDIRGFGGATSFQAAENVKNDVWTVRGKHTIILGNVLNEATVSYQNYKWNPVPAGLEHLRAELRRADADREQGLAAELHAEALCLPRRRDLAEPAVGR